MYSCPALVFLHFTLLHFHLPSSGTLYYNSFTEYHILVWEKSEKYKACYFLCCFNVFPKVSIFSGHEKKTSTCASTHTQVRMHTGPGFHSLKERRQQALCTHEKVLPSLGNTTTSNTNDHTKSLFLACIYPPAHLPQLPLTWAILGTLTSHWFSTSPISSSLFHNSDWPEFLPTYPYN